MINLLPLLPSRLLPRAARRGALAGLLLTLGTVTACAQSSPPPPASAHAPATPATTADSAVAVFAGGCFWCMEPPFDKLPGVRSTTSGYIDGRVANPTYEQVSRGGTGHTEAVRVVYDPSKVNYATLLDVFWRNIDPVAVDRQFCDVGDQYRSAIFATDARQRSLAEASKQQLQASGRFTQPIATQIADASTFYPAEDYHQDYYQKNPVRYRFYRSRCGRDARLEQVWGSGGS